METNSKVSQQSQRSYLVQVRVSGHIVAPLFGVHEGFSFLFGLLHLRFHRLPSDQSVCHVVASLNRATVNYYELNKWTSRSQH